MAYQNINFPTLKLVHGFIEEFETPVNVISNFNREYRINRYSTPKAKFTYQARNMKYADWLTLQTFFGTVKYQKDSFNFVHPLTNVVYKVRLASAPTIQVVALDANKVPTIVTVTDIVLLQVFGE